MISNHQNGVPIRATDSSAAKGQDQRTLSPTDSICSLDRREIYKFGKKSDAPITKSEKKPSSSSVSSFVDGTDAVETETFHAPRRRVYACSLINEVAQAFEMDDIKSEITERTPFRRRAYAIGSMKEFRETFELGPDQNASGLPEFVDTSQQSEHLIEIDTIHGVYHES
jgi:hypothetical protein